MLTRCPSCATHFRVTAEQLKLRAGRVRCGECQHVFNALDTLIEEPALVIASHPPSAREPEPAPAGDQEIAVPPAPTLESADVPAAASDREPIEAEESVVDTPGEAFTAPKTDGAAPELPPEPEPEPATPGDASLEAISIAPAPESEFRPDDPPGETADWDDSYVEPPPPPRRWPWMIGGLLALLALGLQAALAYRVELAVLWPESRPLLLAACGTLGCELALPAKVALVGIEASDLHPDAAQKGRLALTATLKNRAPFAQQFPHLELTLTDTADKAIVRKVLSPDQYLPPGTAIATGMAPNADLAVAIALDAGELPASGYRLYIFYP